MVILSGYDVGILAMDFGYIGSTMIVNKDTISLISNSNIILLLFKIFCGLLISVTHYVLINYNHTNIANNMIYRKFFLVLSILMILISLLLNYLLLNNNPVITLSAYIVYVMTRYCFFISLPQECLIPLFPILNCSTWLIVMIFGIFLTLVGTIITVIASGILVTETAYNISLISRISTLSLLGIAILVMIFSTYIVYYMDYAHDIYYNFFWSLSYILLVVIPIITPIYKILNSSKINIIIFAILLIGVGTIMVVLSMIQKIKCMKLFCFKPKQSRKNTQSSSKTDNNGTSGL